MGLDGKDIQLILKQKNLNFFNYELTPGIFTIQDISDAVHTFSGHSEIIQIEYVDISMKTKIILKFKNNGKLVFGLGTMRFDESSFFHNILGFEPYWQYEATNSNNVAIPGVYISGKILDLSTTKNIHLECDGM